MAAHGAWVPGRVRDIPLARNPSEPISVTAEIPHKCRRSSPSAQAAAQPCPAGQLALDPFLQFLIMVPASQCERAVARDRTPRMTSPQISQPTSYGPLRCFAGLQCTTQFTMTSTIRIKFIHGVLVIACVVPPQVMQLFRLRKTTEFP